MNKARFSNTAESQKNMMKRLNKIKFIEFKSLE